MSQEGTNLPHEVEQSHDHATTPDDSILAGVEPTIVRFIGSSSSSVSNLASEINNTGSKPSSPAVLHASEDNNAESMMTSSVVLHAGEDNNVGSKLTNQAAHHADEDNNTGSKLACPVVLHADEDKNYNVESKPSSPVLLHAGEGNKAESNLAIQVVPHVDKYNNTESNSKLTCPAVLYAGEDKNSRSKIESPMMLHAVVDNNTALVIYAGETNNTGSKLASPPTPHADKNKDNNAGYNIASPEELHAGEDNRDGSNLAIQKVPHGGEDNNTGSKPTNLVAVDTGRKNAKEGKNAREEGGGGDTPSNANMKSIVDGHGAHDTVKNALAAVADGGGGKGRGRGKGKGAAEVDHALHIWTERERRKKMKDMFSALHALLPQLPEKTDKATIVGKAVTYIKTLEGNVQSLEKLKRERICAQAEQLLLGADSGSAAAASSSARHPAPAPAPATREAILANMVHDWNAQEAIMAELKAAASAVVEAAGSSSAAPRGTNVAVEAPVAAPILAPAPPLQTWSAPNIVVCVAGNDAFINLRTPRRPGMLTKVLSVLEKHRINVMATTVSADQSHSLFSIQTRINGTTPAPPQLPENLTIEDRYKLAVAEMLHMVAK